MALSTQLANTTASKVIPASLGRDLENITVIIPLYNKAGYIQRALRSIQTQTHPPFEVIVIDDGSTDDSAAQVAAIADSRIRLVSQPNAGPGAARNRGLALAETDYVAFLDADDEWLPTFLAHSIANLKRHPSCAMTVCGQFRGPEQQDWTPVFRAAGIEPGVWQLTQDLAPEHYKTNLDMFLMGTMVCNRSVLQQFGGFYDKHRCTYGEDNYLWLQVLLNYSVYRDFAPLLWYRTEASDLAIWERSTCPVWAMVTDPDPIRRVCPSNQKPLLEGFLAQYAALAAYRAATRGDLKTLTAMVTQFPQPRRFWCGRRRIYLEALVSMVPGLRQTLRQAKRRLAEWSG